MSSEVDRLIKTDDSATGTDPTDEKDPHDPRNWYPDNNQKRPFWKFDRSPTTKKPHSSSRPVDKDKDRWYHCHQHGHFTRECPQNKKDTKKLIHEGMQEMCKKQQEDAPWREPYDMDSFQEPEPSLN